MTKKRNDDHSTEFGLWLREQPEIDSKLGYVTTNIDYLWENYKTGEWMLIEEKRYMAEPSYSQKKQFIKLYQCLKGLKDRKYRGFHSPYISETTSFGRGGEMSFLNLGVDKLLMTCYYNNYETYYKS